MTDTDHPHGQPRIYAAGAPLASATAAVIMFHGRGAPAQDILSLAREFDAPQAAYLAPQAAGGSWWPQRFVAPFAANEPFATSALRMTAQMLADVQAAGVPAERVVLLGFSQGACLALEFAARNPCRYGGVIALSGALIEEGDKPRAYPGSLADSPVLLGCSDADVHIPLARVERTARILAGMGALVDMQIYPGMGHTVNHDEIKRARAIVAALV